MDQLELSQYFRGSKLKCLNDERPIRMQLGVIGPKCDGLKYEGPECTKS